MGMSEIIEGNGLLNLGSVLIVKLFTVVDSTKTCCLAITTIISDATFMNHFMYSMKGEI